MGKVRIFLDTDVIISSLLSSKGASFQLLERKDIINIISDWIMEETTYTAEKLSIPSSKVLTIKNTTELINLTNKKEIVNRFSKYVQDDKDSHVVAGAVISKSRFLITYNLKHYNTLKIKNDFDIIVLTPGLFLQHLRSN